MGNSSSKVSGNSSSPQVPVPEKASRPVPSTISNIPVPTPQMNETSAPSLTNKNVSSIPKEELTDESELPELSEELFDQYLTDWIGKSNSEERLFLFMSRVEAAEKIKKCYVEQSDSLDLSGLRLKSLPRAIFLLSHLKLLSMEDNSFTELSKEIGKLTKLQTLHLDCISMLSFGVSQSKIIKLPKEIGDLQELQVLSVSGLPLKNFPSEIQNLKKLKIVTIYGCSEISSLPESFKNLISLFIDKKTAIKLLGSNEKYDELVRKKVIEESQVKNCKEFLKWVPLDIDSEALFGDLKNAAET